MSNCRTLSTVCGTIVSYRPKTGIQARTNSGVRKVIDQRIGRVIIVEDDPATRDSIELSFELGFSSVELLKFDRIRPVMTSIDDFRPDLITVDLGLPDGDGLQLIKQIRAKSELPIMVLSGRSDDSTILTAIRLGADDYLVKPFSTIELQAHVEALMRRVQRTEPVQIPPETFELRRNISIDFSTGKLIYNDVPIDLSARELGCLKLLVEADGRIVSNQEFKRTVWSDPTVSDAAIKMVFYRLRKSLGDDESARLLIQSHRGIGYSLSRPE